MPRQHQADCGNSIEIRPGVYVSSELTDGGMWRAWVSLDSINQVVSQPCRIIRLPIYVSRDAGAAIRAATERAKVVDHETLFCDPTVGVVRYI